MNGESFLQGWTTFKSGSLYKSYAKFNPVEASKVDGFVKSLANEKVTSPSGVKTATGKGLIQMLTAAVENKNRAAFVYQASIK